MREDYESTKKYCAEPQIKFDPDLEEIQIFPDNLFQMKIYDVQHSCMYMHWHNYLEIIYFKEGDAVCYLEGKNFPVTKGDILFVNCGEIHAAYSVNNADISFIPIIFDKSLFAAYPSDFFFTEYMVPLLDGRAFFPNLIRPDDSNYNLLLDAMRNIIREYEEKNLGYELCIRSYLQEIIIKAVRAYGLREKPKSTLNVDRSNRFKKLFNYIETHVNEKITAQQAADMVHFSIYHFCKIFKEMTGLTFVEYINLNKVNTAEFLLRHTDSSITEITEKTGFCNVNYFDRIFKKYKGYSPSKVRK